MKVHFTKEETLDICKVAIGQIWPGYEIDTIKIDYTDCLEVSLVKINIAELKVIDLPPEREDNLYQSPPKGATSDDPI